MTDLSTLDALDGLITPAVGAELYRLALEVPADQAIVEVGSYKGMSTAYLAAGARDGHAPKVYAVDPWDKQDPPGTNGRDYYRFADPATRARFEEQLKSVGLWSHVTVRQGFSPDVARRYKGAPVGLLYVDGDHQAEAVQADVEGWLPHLAEDGLVAFDDYVSPKNTGVREAVDALRARALDPAVAIRATRLAVCTPRPESS